MEIDEKIFQRLLQKVEYLQVELKSLYETLYSLDPVVKELDKRKKREELVLEMRKRLIKAARIKMK